VPIVNMGVDLPLSNLTIEAYMSTLQLVHNGYHKNTSPSNSRMAGIALVVAAMVVKRYMKKREEGEKGRRETD
jgi:hypothetical protein